MEVPRVKFCFDKIFENIQELMRKAVARTLIGGLWEGGGDGRIFSYNYVFARMFCPVYKPGNVEAILLLFLRIATAIVI